MDYAELGRRIRQAREEASLSQDVVAQHLGLPRSAVSLIESGKRKIDSLELRTFSRLVGRSIAFFLDDEVETVESQPIDNDLPTHILFSANQVVDISRDRPQIERFAQFHREFANLARMLNRPTGSYSAQPRYNVYKPTPAAAKWMANQERARLGLPLSSPIKDMRIILQSQGVKLMAWDLQTSKLGGCFIFSPKLGSFVLVKRNLRDYSANMINFVLAHEYCHHLIHRQQQGTTCDPNGNYRKPEEYFAQWFAANFLMPEEALVPRLQKYLEQGNAEREITPEVVMNLALDFSVSYKAMLNRMSSKGVELIDGEVRKQLEKAKVTDLLVQIGRSTLRLDISKFPEEYVEIAVEAYRREIITFGKLAELLDSEEEAEAQLAARGVLIDLGVDSEDELLSDIENA